MTTLSNAIIYNTVADIKRLLAQHPPLNEIDDYGYTPLTQTAIVDDVEKARLILEAGADVNMADLTGRTALHWAADNNNYHLCALLLEHQANPNAYTTAGQPILVMPLLRQQRELVKLLQQHGGDIDFAQDFINAKLLSHRFELKGRADIVDPKNTFIELSYEGFYLEFTVSVVLNSLTQFRNNYHMRNLRHYDAILKNVIQCFEVATELLKLQNYRTKPEQHQSKINALLSGPIVIIPIACQGHAIIMVRCNNYMIRCDRGAYGREHGTVILYKMNRPQALTNKLMTHLIYQHTTQQEVNEELPQLLGFEKLTTLPLSEQITGNCSWANVEAAIPAIMIMHLLSEDHPEESALKFFHEWERWDQNRALYFCIERLESSASPARQSSYATILAAILFQRCDHDRDEDLAIAKKIVKVLSKPEFKYLLQNYYEVYAKDKRLPEGHNFLKILDDFGITL